MGRRASVKMFCEEGVRLLGDNVGGIGNGDRATLRDDVCGSVGSFCLCEARALQMWSRDLGLRKDQKANLPPALYLSDLSTERSSLARHDLG